MLRLTFFILLSQAAIGALVPVAFVSFADTGRMFVRFMSGLALVLLILALWAQPFGSIPSGTPLPLFGSAKSTIYLLMAGSMALLVIANVLWPRWAKTFLWLAIATGFASGALLAAVFPVARAAVQTPYWLTAASFAASTLLLGSALGTMITGHWYLVNHWSGAGIFLGARVAFGVIAPLVFGYMIWKTVRLRSTQSATGILYATVIFVIVGEAFSKFVFYFTSLPV